MPGGAFAQQRPDSVKAKQDLQIQAECYLGGGRGEWLYVSSLMAMTYDRSAPEHDGKYLKRGKARLLSSIARSLETSECTGVQIDLARPDSGTPLKGTDVVPMAGAGIVSRTDSFFVIEWGLYVLTVDVKSRTVKLRYDATAICACDSR